MQSMGLVNDHVDACFRKEIVADLRQNLGALNVIKLKIADEKVPITSGGVKMKGKRITTGSPFEAMAGYSRAVVDEDIAYISKITGYDARNKCYPLMKRQAIMDFQL